MAESHVVNVTGSPKSTPFEYDVPGSLELLLKSIRGVWDGSGAASSFVPVITIRTGADKIVARCRADETVQAGGSADVTFSPF